MMRKITIWFLVLTMLLSQVLPQSITEVYAYESGISLDDSEDVKYGDDKDPSQLDLEEEIVDKRTAHTKTFLKSDGSYQTIMYEEVIHYENDEGQWIEIDNHLLDIGDSVTNLYNPLSIEFPKEMNQEKMIHMSYDSYEIDFSFQSMGSSTLSYSNSDVIDDLTEPKHFEQKLTYDDVLEGVDLEYIMLGMKLKENILLNHYQEDFEMSFVYHLKGLSFISEDENIYLVNQSGEKVMFFSQRYMSDGSGKSSSDIEITYEEVAKDTYDLKVKPSDAWLSEATYPVIIDPTIELTSYDSSYEYYTYDNNHIYTQGLKVGDDSEDIYRGYIHIKTDSIPHYATLNYTYIETRLSMNELNTDETVLAHTVEGSPSISNGTFNTRYASEEAIDYNKIGKGDPLGTTYLFDITQAYQNWITEDMPIGRIELKYEDESHTGFFDDDHTIRFASKLIIGYTETTGLYDYMTYQTHEIENYLGYIQDYSGLLTGLRTEINFLTEKQSLQLNMYHNEADKEVNIGYGLGYRTNYTMSVIYDMITDQYYVKDGSGATTYYVFQDEEKLDYGNIEKYYIAEDGSQSKLTVKGYVGEDEFIVSSAVIYTKDKISFKFGQRYNNAFYLTNITDEQTNLGLSIYYVKQESAQILKVVDSSLNTINFSYVNDKISEVTLDLYQFNGTYNQVEKITYDYQDRSVIVYEKQIVVTENGLEMIFVPVYLTVETDYIEKVTYQTDFDKDGVFSTDQTLSYTYDDSSIASVDDGTNQILYTYIGSKVSEVSYKVNHELLDVTNYTYDLNQMTIMDSDQNSICYTFDHFGHTISMYHSDGYYQTFSYETLFTTDIEDEGLNYLDNHKLIYASDPIFYDTNHIINGSYERVNDFLEGWVFDHGLESYVEVHDISVDGKKSIVITNDQASSSVLYQSVEIDQGTYYLSGYIKKDNDAQMIHVVGSDIENIETNIYSYNDAFDYVIISFESLNQQSVLIELSVSGLNEGIFDDIRLSTKLNMSLNLLYNGDFEIDAYDMWQFSDNDQVGISEVNSPFGPYALTISSHQNSEEATIDITDYLDNDMMYTFSVWSMLAGSKVNVNERLYEMKITYEVYISESETYTFFDSVQFNSSVDGWQNEQIIIYKHQDIINVKVSLLYEGIGKAYFDGFSLIEGLGGTSYTYDEGILKDVTDQYGNVTTYETIDLNPFNEVIDDSLRKAVKITYPDQTYEIISYEDYYSSYFSQTNNARSQITMNRDGQIIKTIYGDDMIFLDTYTSYLSAFNGQYVSSYQDQHGRKTTYDFDTMTGLLNTIEKANGQEVSYSYYDDGLLYQVVEGDHDTTYVYDEENRLIEIKIDDAYGYKIIYDTLGRMMEVKVKNAFYETSLMHYTYVDENGIYTSNIETQYYGNEDFYQFEYNDEDQITKVYLGKDINHDGIASPYEYQLKFEYAYDLFGLLKTYYQYQDEKDISGQLVIEHMETYYYTTEGLLDYYMDEKNNKVEYVYEANQLVGMRYEINGETFEMNYDSSSEVTSYVDLLKEEQSLNFMINEIGFSLVPSNQNAQMDLWHNRVLFESDGFQLDYINTPFIGGIIPVQSGGSYRLAFDLNQLSGDAQIKVYEFDHIPDLTDVYLASIKGDLIHDVGDHQMVFEVQDNTQFIMISFESDQPIYGFDMSNIHLYQTNKTVGLYDQTSYMTLNQNEIIKNYLYQSDALSRLSYITLSLDDTLLYDQSYHYDDDHYIDRLEYSLKNDRIQYFYTYDDMGYIDHIKTYIDGVLSVEETYVYDLYGQVIQTSRLDVWDSTIQKTYTKQFAYDAHGNIISETTYPYGIEALTRSNAVTRRTDWYLGQFVSGCGFYSYTAPLTFDVLNKVSLDENYTQVLVTYDQNKAYAATTFTYVVINGITYQLNLTYPGQSKLLYIPLSSLNYNSQTQSYTLNLEFLAYEGCNSGYSYYQPQSVEVEVIDKNVIYEVKTYQYINDWTDQLSSITTSTYHMTNGLIDQKIKSYDYDDQGNIIEMSAFNYKDDIYEAELLYVGRDLEAIYLYQGDDLNVEIKYTYNDQGYRIKKELIENDQSITTDYVLQDDLVISETIITSTQTKTEVQAIIYRYDYDGSLIGFYYDDDLSDQVLGQDYYYMFNLQNDVTHIIDSSGEIVVTYTYDAWGNIIDIKGSDIKDINPYRYRSYRYDDETGFYYLQSRYYDSDMHRFISSDGLLGDIGDSLSHNMYAYTLNNPVMYVDPTGEFWDYIFDVVSIGWSIWDFYEDPSWSNFGWLALDVVFAVIPFLTGSKVLKLTSKSDEVVDAIKYTNKLDNIGDAIVIGNGMDNVIYAANKLDAAYYAGYAPLNALRDAGKITDATIGMKMMGRVDNAKWLVGNLNKGVTVIDIGRNRSMYKAFISAYGWEKRVIFYYYNGGQIISRGARLIW